MRYNFMKIFKYLKQYDKYYINHFLSYNCDGFITWYFKQKYYSKPQQCPECKQVKMLLYDEEMCPECFNKFLNDLLEKIEKNK